MTLTQEMIDERAREIEAVAKLRERAFEDGDMNAFFRLGERLNGLHYAAHLIQGNSEALACYQTGMPGRNSHGAKYTPKEDF